jgi:predicted outer membrane repeat protein
MCTVNGVLLRPCYSLQQLSNVSTLLSTRKSVTLLFLPGRHIISQTFTACDVGRLNIHPWINEQVTVECQLPTQLLFYNVGELVVFSFNFTSCTLQYLLTGHSTQVDESILHFNNCIFTANPLNYTLMITNTVRLKSNISMNNCTFSSNNGAVTMIFSFSGSSLLITDSDFFHNQRKGVGSTLIDYSYVKMSIMISIYRSQFINNTAISSGAIQCRLLEIHNCFFKSNFGEIGGAISTRKLVAENCIFQDNFANLEGGAILADIVNISNCHFENNSAGRSGGALSIGIQYGTVRDMVSISNSSFNSNAAGLHGGAIYCTMIESLLYFKSKILPQKMEGSCI